MPPDSWMDYMGFQMNPLWWGHRMQKPTKSWCLGSGRNNGRDYDAIFDFRPGPLVTEEEEVNLLTFRSRPQAIFDLGTTARIPKCVIPKAVASSKCLLTQIGRV